MGDVGIEAVIVGPGSPGLLKISLTRGTRSPSTLDIAIDAIPESSRTPNARVVAVFRGTNLVRVETMERARARLEVEDRVRRVLNDEWDPIGVAHAVDDEYDSYVGDILDLIRGGASEQRLARHLLEIETVSMGLSRSALDRRLRVARRLLALALTTE